MPSARKYEHLGLAPKKSLANTKEALDCIDRNSPLGQIIQKSEDIILLQQALNISLNKNGLKKTIPLVKIVGFSKDTGELKICTNNSAVSTRLQQKLPSILFNLQELGWAVQLLRIKQTPEELIIDPQKIYHIDKPFVFTKSAQRAWLTLHNLLEEGSTLKAAINNLLRRNA